MRHIFTSESVSEGLPDKMADQISDAVLDAILGDAHSTDEAEIARLEVRTVINLGGVDPHNCWWTTLVLLHRARDFAQPPWYSR